MNSENDSLFRALSDPTRRGLLERLLAEGEVPVHALTVTAGVSQPAVSKHLAVLAAAGLVTDRRAGRETFYAAVPQNLGPMVVWIDRYRSFWDQHLDALDQLLKRMD